jgi:hypothetical protein
MLEPHTLTATARADAHAEGDEQPAAVNAPEIESATTETADDAADARATAETYA